MSKQKAYPSTPIQVVLAPMQEFIHRSASGGIVLIGATLIALLLANSPLAESYDEFLHSYITISAGPYQLKLSLHHWINDALMAIFFFVVGLEIKREVSVGELANPRAAALPIVAALGGVAVPALIYLAFNAGGIGAKGWGIPMATDIAFALGCLALLGDRVPFSLKIFLTAVAIVDDLIAVLVIAFFYTADLNFAALAIGFLVLGLLFIANRLGVRAILFYAVLGMVVWLAFLTSGVHATIAGVLLALTIPARHTIDDKTFLRRARRLLDEFEQGESAPSPMLTNEKQQSAVIALEEACEQVQAPLQKLEHDLHVWVSFLIMPIFALANAGVPLSFASLGGETLPVTLGIVAGLVLGKPIGLVGASWLAIRSGMTSLPAGANWYQMVGTGVLAGIGFTMSLFIASLGFGADPLLLETAKLAILVASLVAGFAGYAMLARSTPARFK
ncbi:MAG: Na+/H+ antiporter NhaA [Ardenticatenales bacterium]|nr:Na+/H+ antiporter NhaA [Ardenticatenales bacterium]